MRLTDLKQAYAGRTVLITGHSGFKGSWLTLWLASMGARVVGLSLPPDQGPDNLFSRAAVADVCQSLWVDIRDADAVAHALWQSQPEIVLHLAAQPLVRRAYSDPLLTFATNIQGTANVLEATRLTPSARAVVVVTTDKVYDNREWHWPYRETDALGGIDPYSASKSAAEMIARSYMTALRDAKGHLTMATARGGNVVGGGDWSEDRIVPDIIRSLRAERPLLLRSPLATRPWQHVLELCLGYLILAARLKDGWPERSRAVGDFSGAWNFGPDAGHEVPVQRLVDGMLSAMQRPDFTRELGAAGPHESRYLRLDSSKAKAELGWRPLLALDETISWTARWYAGYLEDPEVARRLTMTQIIDYEALVDDKLRS